MILIIVARIFLYFFAAVLFGDAIAADVPDSYTGNEDNAHLGPNEHLSDQNIFEIIHGTSTLHQSIGISSTVFYLGLFDDHALCQ